MLKKIRNCFTLLLKPFFNLKLGRKHSYETIWQLYKKSDKLNCNDLFKSTKKIGTTEPGFVLRFFKTLHTPLLHSGGQDYITFHSSPQLMKSPRLLSGIQQPDLLQYCFYSYEDYIIIIVKIKTRIDYHRKKIKSDTLSGWLK